MKLQDSILEILVIQFRKTPPKLLEKLNEFDKSKNAMKRAYGTSPTKKELKALKDVRKFINDKEDRFKANR